MKKPLFLGICAVLVAATLCSIKLGFAQTKTTTSSAKSSSADDKAAIEALEQRYVKAFNAKDVNAIMENYAPANQLFVFDAVPPREYPNWEAYKKDWEGLLAAYPGPLKDEMSELNINVVGPLAYAHRIETTSLTRKDGSHLTVVVRVTDVFRKFNGKWLIVHEHVSVPVDLDTGKADLLSKR